MKKATWTGRLGLVLLILGLAVKASPEGTVLLSLKEVAAAGKAGSLEYAKASYEAAVAAAALTPIVKLKTATLSAAYVWADPQAATTSSTSSEGFSLSAELPIIDQVSLTAKVAATSASSLAATLSPLAHSDERALSLVAWAKAEAALEEAGRVASSDAVRAALAWMNQKRQLETLEKEAALKEAVWKAAKASNAIDPATTSLDDLVTAMKDWSDARRALAKGQAGARTAEALVEAAVASAGEGVRVVALDEKALAAALDVFEASLAGSLASGPARSYALKAASLDVEGGLAKVGSIWAFEPDLAMSVGLSVPVSGAPTPTASIRLSLSLDDLKVEKKRLAQVSLELARRSEASQVSADARAWEAALAAVTTAKINRDSSRIARDQAAELAEVAAFSLHSGSYSKLENEAATLSLDAAEAGLYSALVDEYLAWLDLAGLAGR